MRLTTYARIVAPWGQGGENSALDLFEIETLGNYRDKFTFLDVCEDVKDEEEAMEKAREYLERFAGKEPSPGEVTFTFSIWERGEGITKEATIRYVRKGLHIGRFTLDHSALFRGYVTRRKGVYKAPRYHKGKFARRGVIIEWDRANYASTNYAIREYYYWTPLSPSDLSAEIGDPLRWARK